MSLFESVEGKNYVINGVDTNDGELNSFLFSLGCYAGESVSVVSKRKSGCVILLKNARYSIDRELARCITVM